jgi:chromosome partitioning protein
MRAIAIMNQKGGVGKTTTAVNLSAALAEAGQRVVLIDLDPQAHATLHLGLTLREGQPSVYDVLVGPLGFDEVWHAMESRLWLVPAHLDLAAAEVELAHVEHRETILRQKWAQVSAEFDFMVIDCPPSLGVLTINALTLVREVFLPMQPHFLALHGLSKLLRTVELIRQRLNPALRLSGVLLCMYDANTRLASEVSQDVAAFFEQSRAGHAVATAARLFQTRIRRNVRLAEAPSFGQTILQYAPTSHGAEDYRALAREVLAQQTLVAEPQAAEPPAAWVGRAA